jgi:hypothetical protein
MNIDFDPDYIKARHRRRMRILPIRFHSGNDTWGYLYWTWRFGQRIATKSKTLKARLARGY